MSDLIIGVGDSINLSRRPAVDIALRLRLSKGLLPFQIGQPLNIVKAMGLARRLPYVNHPDHAMPDGFGIMPPEKKMMPVKIRAGRSIYGREIKGAQGVIGAAWVVSHSEYVVIRVWYRNPVTPEKPEFVDIYETSLTAIYKEAAIGWQIGYLGDASLEIELED